VKVVFKKSFAKDLKKKSKNRKLSAKVEQIIGQVDEAEETHQIPNLKKTPSLQKSLGRQSQVRMEA
jgi:mRNA-degrading endonuclease RelE of RelBE toxin-antitoxin system